MRAFASHPAAIECRHAHRASRIAIEGRGAQMAEEPATLNGISALRGFFRTNQTPIYFISPVAFNLLGIDRWVRRFEYINYFDSFDGGHPRVFVPERSPHAQFSSIEDVCNYLMTHAQVQEYVKGRRSVAIPRGEAVFVFFDEET